MEKPNVVAKISWPNKNRAGEMHIINKARKAADDLANHLPLVLGSCDIREDTGVIRSRLGIDGESPRAPRVLRIIIFEELHPLTDLRWEEFLTAWLHCVRCHHVTWEGGVHHRDLSLKNLMYRREGGKVFGVVNDWDLSHLYGESEESLDLTATIPFLSREVLEYLAGDEPIDRCYYHDLESFLWTLLWMFLFVEGGRVDHDDVNLKKLTTSTASACWAEKKLLLDRLKRGRVQSRLWPVGRELIDWSDNCIALGLDQRGDNASLFKSFVDVVQICTPDSYSLPTILNVL
ncbi:hypothetical protein FRC06_006993 [Ceratobasidium sp. 370]|nr:hypothetical protein FRC06_006993 [Ceratobasidium sp. 370]